jgi:hypothetical protein
VDRVIVGNELPACKTGLFGKLNFIYTTANVFNARNLTAVYISKI